jgi:hypothetical protein
MTHESGARSGKWTADVRDGSKGEELTTSKCFPLCPQTRTSPGAFGMSQRCQERKKHKGVLSPNDQNPFENRCRPGQPSASRRVTPSRTDWRRSSAFLRASESDMVGVAAERPRAFVRHQRITV